MTHEPTPSPDDLTTLHVRRMVDGDRASLEWLVTRFTPLLRAQADHHLRDFPEQRSEDLVSDTWLAALPKLAHLEPTGTRLTPPLVKFLSQTLLFLVKNQLRKAVRRSPRDVAVRVADQELPAETLGVVTRVVREEHADQVHRCIAELDRLDRDVVVLRGIEQRSNEVAGVLLGLPPGTVASRYSRALQKLRDRLPGVIFDELRD